MCRINPSYRHGNKGDENCFVCTPELQTQVNVLRLLAKIKAFELETNQSPQRRKEAFASLSPLVRGLVDDVRTKFEQGNDTTIYFPALLRL